MIELINVHKTYKSKKSKNTKALDDVSLNFNDKGMTFILGKSGSGKSTLLNIIGGLDKYDSGDMLILGKSSKDFTQADFDSYRNTYVGFIFQEFNILDDYDVYENIVLALQLQQKEVNESEIDKLLDKLELTELKKRKVNELSGGQKQRVAIARALIKDPKIILADEPTGNLDSKTGRQVMELLKEIAKEKLVVVVSHDEEYAQKYGDRIIEIKDGRIINDTKDVKENSNLKNTYKTIKSHLPFKESFKLGIGSLKHKKIKLVFTILITIFTLGFLSCADTLSSYDFSVSHSKLLSDRNEQFIQVEKKHVYTDEDGFTNTINLPMDDDSVTKIEEQLGKSGYDVYNYYSEMHNSSYDINELLHIQNSTEYEIYPTEIVVTSDISNILKEDITGRKPNTAGEIVISNYIANLIIEKGIEVHENVVKNEFKESNIFEPKSYDDILNTNYNYYFGESEKIKIVGIINYNLDNISNEYKYNVLRKIFVSPDFITNLKKVELSNLRSILETEVIIEGITPTSDDSISDSDSTNIFINSYNSYVSTAVLNHQIEYFDGTEWKKIGNLKENEVILNINQLTNGDSYYDDLNNYVNNNLNYEDYNTLEKKFLANYIKEKDIIGKNLELKIYYDRFFGILAEDYNNLTVIGVYYKDDSCNNYSGDEVCMSSDANYFSSDLLGEYVQSQIERSSVLYPMTTKEDFQEITDMFPIESELAIKSTYSESLYYERILLDSIKTLAFYASIIFLIFTIFLIINFMFTSISYRKKEIGILRALGARSKDVMKIFLWEGFGLALISGTIASILLVIVSDLMNSFIMGQTSMLTTPFIVGIRQFVVIYLLVFAVTIVSSILPIIRISKMKPIDAILNK